MGFQTSIGNPGGLQFHYRSEEVLSNADAELAIGYLQSLCWRYDVGLSPGNRIGLIGFHDSGQNESTIELFRQRFPNAIVSN